MANMTYLSEASVVHNLRSRYELFLIYTYSGNNSDQLLEALKLEADSL